MFPFFINPLCRKAAFYNTSKSNQKIVNKEILLNGLKAFFKMLIFYINFNYKTKISLNLLYKNKKNIRKFKLLDLLLLSQTINN